LGAKKMGLVNPLNVDEWMNIEWMNPSANLGRADDLHGNLVQAQTDPLNVGF
jgi:hypothetical protein